MATYKLDLLRKAMKEQNVSAIIVPMADPHFGEYTQEHYKCIKWLSGFDGSAGTIVVTMKDAALWTDSRYFLQATIQLANSGIELQRLKMPGTESIEVWLKGRLQARERVGVVKDLFSFSEFSSLKSELVPLDLIEIEDIFQNIWKSRPAVEFYSIDQLDDIYAGESISSKHSRVVEEIREEGDFIYILSTCDDIAWLFNIRGKDIKYNPVSFSYAAITREQLYLFVKNGTVCEELYKKLTNEGVSIREYDDFEQFLLNYSANAVRIAPPDKISLRKYTISLLSGATFKSDTLRGGIVANLKAVKNPTEINGFRKAMILDGVAWVKYLRYIEKRLQDVDNPLGEWEAAGMIGRFRAESDLYVGESFAPIVAFGHNAALPHYEPSEEIQSIIAKDNFLLTDTGGQYICGTTDTTRTIAIGEITEEQKRDYTLVLAGMIDLAMAKFPTGTRGAQLDILARGKVFSVGKMYLHGTGHGVGHYLCVHEGPQSIRMEDNLVTFKPGMVTSDEPAIYEEGRYGIRSENLLLCREWCRNNAGTFLEFETLTLVPFDTRPILRNLLGEERVNWLNEYHQRVFRELSPYLKNEDREWLKTKTANID
ncbi:MAG TPA: aminopeptidase P family protein [Bacteroidales bacterium]|nr:aminopeptidase P family protein [Bacteroidales bacterium]HRT33537.1 aminopeptidase P family protein [Bacteroidales bacterium]